MQVADRDTVFGQVFGEVFGHALGQGGDQNTVTIGDAEVDFREQVIDLGRDWSDLDLRIDQPGRSDHQFDHFTGRLLQLVRARCR